MYILLVLQVLLVLSILLMLLAFHISCQWLTKVLLIQ